MVKITGYDGGDGEPALLAALKERLATESTDAWTRVRAKDMYIGAIIEIAVARGYIKASRLGFAGYMVTKIGFAETHCRDCLKCWQKRRDFDTVREWVATANGFRPAKLSGPLLYLVSHKAWSARLTPDAPKKKPKRLTAKELRQLIQAYRNMRDRSGGVIVKWADEDGRDAREWNRIVAERAAIEAELSEPDDDSDFPVSSIHDNAEPEEPEDDVPETEQYPGTESSPEPEVEAPDPVEPEQDVPVEEPYRGEESSPAAIAAPERPPWVSAAAIIPEWLAREPVAHDPPNDIPAAPMTAEEALQRPVFADTTPDEPEEVADPAPVAERGEPISDINPPPDFEPDPLDTPLRPLDADTTKMVQKIYDLPKWKGKITEAHQLRAQFFRACVGECPPSLRIPTASWWLGMRGKLPREMIADAAARIDEAA